MPQIFQVLRCYQCQVFQVHQTKKSKNFQCKLCGEKQSIKRHYGIGTAKDCRGHVQRLNGIRGEIDKLKENKSFDSEEENDLDIKVQIPAKARKAEKSKWSDYVDKNEEEGSKPAPETETMYLHNTEVVLEVPKKRRRANFKCPALKISNETIENSYCENNVSNAVVRSQTRQECIYFNYRDFDILESNISSSNHYANLEPKPKVKKPFVNMERRKVGWEKIEPDTEVIESIKPFVNTKPNVMSTNDGWAEFEPKPEMKPIVNTLKEARKIMAPAVNSNSKWAQFVEEEHEEYDTEDTEEIDVFQVNHEICVTKSDSQNYEEEVDQYGPIPTATGNKNSQELFALCDDNELDDVLDI